jgi:hypothetical protein
MERIGLGLFIAERLALLLVTYIALRSFRRKRER